MRRFFVNSLVITAKIESVEEEQAIARGSKAELLRDNWQHAIFVLVGRIDLVAKNVGKGTTTYITTLYVERATIQHDIRDVQPLGINNVVALPLDDIQKIAI